MYDRLTNCLTEAMLSLVILAVNVPATDAAQIRCQQKWSNVFGKTTIELDCQVIGDKQVAAVAQWAYRANNNRTIARGEKQLELAPGDPIALPIELRVPDIKDGVVWKTTLAINVTPRGNNKSIASLEKTLWIFPRNPWISKQSQLVDLKIALFDPQDQTANLLAKHNIPHTRVQRLAQIEVLDQGVVIVGEGTSLDRRLSEALISAARHGVDILILAPTDGAMTMDTIDDLPVEQITLRRHSIVRELDKRLDTTVWQGELRVSQFAIRTDMATLAATVNNQDAMWPWISIEFHEDELLRRRIVFCGFHLLGSWDKTPTPRYLFAQLLESFADSKPQLQK